MGAWVKENSMNGKRCASMLAGLVGAAGIIAITGCQHTVANSAAEKAYNDALNACERQAQTDVRQQCFDQAHQKYQNALRKGVASSCPKSTC